MPTPCAVELRWHLGLHTKSVKANNQPFHLVVLQTASSLKTRLNLMLETIRALPSASSITPTFDHMAVDTSWERKVLEKVTWLHIPGTCWYTEKDRNDTSYSAGACVLSASPCSRRLSNIGRSALGGLGRREARTTNPARPLLDLDTTIMLRYVWNGTYSSTYYAGYFSNS